MKILVNGEEIEFKDGTSIFEILELLQIREKVMACAVNMSVVKEENWKEFSPKDGDKVEFLQFVGGG
jgi:sulfur carrier protein